MEEFAATIGECHEEGEQDADAAAAAAGEPPVAAASEVVVDVGDVGDDVVPAAAAAAEVQSLCMLLEQTDVADDRAY